MKIAVVGAGIAGNGAAWLLSRQHEVVRRLRADPTVGRQDDLKVAIEWPDAAVGLGLEDFAVANEGAVRETSAAILERLGWLE